LNHKKRPDCIRDLLMQKPAKRQRMGD